MMKNLKKLFVVMLMLGLVACSSGEEKTSGVQTTCSQTILGMNLQYVVEADSEDGDITVAKVVLDATYENLGFSGDDLDEDAKQDLLDQMEASMGFEDEGIEVNSEFTDTGLYIEAILSQEYILEEAGEDADISYATFLSDLESSGLTCE